MEASFEWLLDLVPFLVVALIFLKGMLVMGREALHDIHDFVRKHHQGLLILTAAVAILIVLALPGFSH